MFLVEACFHREAARLSAWQRPTRRRLVEAFPARRPKMSDSRARNQDNSVRLTFLRHHGASNPPVLAQVRHASSIFRHDPGQQ